MVRWIKKGQNQYEHDFSILEKYLDVVVKNLGRPKITQVYRQWYEGVGKRSDPAAGLKWYIASGWQERDAKLFDLAGEVEKALTSQPGR
jgi:hypothetical protein